MDKRLLTGAALLALGLFALDCSSTDGGDADGGSGGESGGSGGESSGGKGGSTSKGGSGGKGGAGGQGGSATGDGSGGSAGNNGSGGSEASGGTGGVAGGSGGAGGAASGSGGAGGRRMYVIKHPTWDFETGVQGWDDGAVALGAAQCEHGRWTAGDPMVTMEDKKDGTSAIVYDIDAVKSKTQYDTVGCAGAAKSNMALRVSGTPLLGAVDLLTLNTTARLLPTGTKIVYNLKSSVAGLPIQGYIIAPGPGWSNVNAVTEEGWMTLTHTLAADYKFGPGYNEIGIFIPSVPADFKAKIFIDSVDIILP